MKRILFGFFGAVLVAVGANAAETSIKTATTNTVRHKVYDIQYGSAAAAQLDARGYRKGVVPQTKELTNARGTTTTSGAGGSLTVDGSAVAVGSLGATTNNVPTETITANTANIAVLQRDKLVVPATNSSCTVSQPCGYVSKGGHTNTTADREWVLIAQ